MSQRVLKPPEEPHCRNRDLHDEVISGGWGHIQFSHFWRGSQGRLLDSRERFWGSWECFEKGLRVSNKVPEFLLYWKDAWVSLYSTLVPERVPAVETTMCDLVCRNKQQNTTQSCRIHNTSTCVVCVFICGVCLAVHFIFWNEMDWTLTDIKSTAVSWHFDKNTHTPTLS